MRLEDDVRDAMKKRNYKRVESIFSKHLNSSFSVDLYTEYLAYVSSTNKDLMKEAISVAYTRTLYNIHSVDIKIRYLESLMEDEDAERVKEAYVKIVQIPILKVDTVIELYKNYESSKTKHQKKETDLLSKEAAAMDEAKKLQHIPTAIALLEYVIEQHKSKHFMYTAECVLYNIDSVLNTDSTTSRNKSRMYLYKILLLSKTGVEKDTIVDKHSKGIVISKGVSEKNEKICDMLWGAIRSGGDLLPLVFMLLGHSGDVDRILELAPPGITKKSESFYLILFSAILKYMGINGMRKYLIALAKDKKIGYVVYNYCATVEGLIGGGNKYAGGIILTAFKTFLNSHEKRASSCISSQENAYRIAMDGTQLLLSLGDVQRAHILIDLYNREIGRSKVPPPARNQEETDPKMVMVKHQVLYESGLTAAVSLAGEYAYPEIFDALCRIYKVQEDEEMKLPSVIKKLIGMLPKISENQNIFTCVDLNRFLHILVDIEI
ncbi:uncharacterized protein NEMAJ01_1126 [Nematocida major]|uniref:uncharacterized protein n=1 Tax=Nematocida major TaxID=1912982 RepID=UPI002008ACD8|nr:uncharacterized protein NEMAJ01_1126 [Nematocida major]KAH9386230.1 hypothetical protein NEMAJ01_1126 [Nematocida major]